VQSLAACLSAKLDPESWDYNHLPLREQVDVHSVRALEIDLFNDPQGGEVAPQAGGWVSTRRGRRERRDE
jgi:hypothetical protein